MNFVQRAGELSGQIIADWRHLHQDPEFGMDLPETCKYVRGFRRWAVRSPTAAEGSQPPPARRDRQVHVPAWRGGHAGSKVHIIPSSASLEGTIRFFDHAAHDRIVERMQHIADGVSLATGTKRTLTTEALPALMDDTALCAALGPEIAGIPGLEFSVESNPLNASEDFALVAEKVPTMYLLLGVGVDGGVTNHNPCAVFYDDKLYLASAAIAKAAVIYLEL